MLKQIQIDKTKQLSEVALDLKNHIEALSSSGSFLMAEDLKTKNGLVFSLNRDVFAGNKIISNFKKLK